MRKKIQIKAAMFFIAAFFLFAFTSGEFDPWFLSGTHFRYAYYDKDGNFIAHADATVKKTRNGHDTLFSESEVSWSTGVGAEAVGKGLFLFARDSVSFLVDPGNLVPPKIRYDETRDVSISGPLIRYPLRPVKNTPLPPVTATMTFTRPAGNAVMLYELTDRTVESRDTISIPAGKFPCWIISSTEHIRQLSIKRNTKEKTRRVKEWYSPSAGIVKTEYSRDGVVEQVCVLTAME